MDIEQAKQMLAEIVIRAESIRDDLCSKQATPARVWQDWDVVEDRHTAFVFVRLPSNRVPESCPSYPWISLDVKTDIRSDAYQNERGVKYLGNLKDIIASLQGGKAAQQSS